MLGALRSVPPSTCVLTYVCLILIVAVACLIPRSCTSDEELYTPQPISVTLTVPKSVETHYASRSDSVRYAHLIDSLEALRKQLKAAGVRRSIVYDTIITITRAGVRYDDSVTVRVDDIQRHATLSIRSSPRPAVVSRTSAVYVGGDLTHDLERLRPRALVGYRLPIDDRLELCTQLETLLDGNIVRAQGSIGIRITL